MANIMSIANIKNRPSRNGFDLSQKINFTAKAGEIIPVWWQPTIAGDTMDISLDSFTRTRPLNSSAFARLRGYYDFYFVPMEQLWNKFNTAVIRMSENLLHASGPVLADNVALSDDLPYFTSEQVANYIADLSDSVNQFGYYRAWLTCRLLEYLGYGLFYDYISQDCGGTGKSWTSFPQLKNLRFSPFPLLAYQKIYSDYFRYTQWERSNPSTFNLDYISGTIEDLQMSFEVDGFLDSFNLLDLRYCNYQRDLLHGTIPQAQFGEAAVVDVTSTGVDIGSDGALRFVTYPAVSSVVNGTPISTDNLKSDGSSSSFVLRTGSTSGSPSTFLRYHSGLTGEVSNAGSISILALRRAEAAQKYKEIALAAENDYASQLKAHWDVNVSRYLSEMCYSLGSVTVDLSINEVVNTNITDDNAAQIAGKGTLSGNGHVRLSFPDQYGIVMCVFHVLPMLDYTTSAPHFGTMLTNVLQYPIPEFDQIGMEQVPVIRGLNPVGGSVPSGSVDPNLFFGYAPEYFDWKTALDRSMGAFRDSLKYWIIPFDDEALLAADSVDFDNSSNVETDSVKAGFFKVNPAILDNLFAVDADSKPDTDQFLCSSFFKVHVVRKLDANGLPY